ncbi:J domain-containing protein, partial [bacterium]|nr:J domain-containing protein [bacterium]
YRRLALRYHPDRVASQGEQERAAAERIFQQIGSAKDVIFKARGLK